MARGLATAAYIIISFNKNYKLLLSFKHILIFNREIDFDIFNTCSYFNYKSLP